ncbi:chorismate mutase [archaeon SCG-AAA382B04]|nr:chorismate mutase [archaeon SCG-AAA382B04]
MTIRKTRKEIEKIDKEIIDLIEKRMQHIKELTELKKKQNKPINDKQREKKLLAMYTDYANEKPLDAHEIKEIFEKLHKMSKEIQKTYMGEGNLP